jgi:2-dehydrotetronate isomerase
MMQRFEAAAHDGFKAVEYLFPYAFASNELKRALDANGLQQVLFNAPAGGLNAAGFDAAWARGDRGTAALPGREAEFQAGFAQALEYAHALGCPRVHVMAGIVPAGVVTGDAHACYLRNLTWACQQAAEQGITVMIEPINQRDMPGYFLRTQAQAHAVLAELSAVNLQVQMDLYHCQIEEGGIATKLRQYLPTGSVGHLQIASVPMRQEPDDGELNYPYLFKHIDELGYRGWIGCEYRPRLGAVEGGTSRGLVWLKTAASTT